MPIAALPTIVVALAALAPSISAQVSGDGRVPTLRVEGRHFVDPDGRVVVLRGVNLAGDAKVPPFRPIAHPSQLDQLPRFGFNAVRLVFIWEAFEPAPGRYDDAYLADMIVVASACCERGLFVVVDFHQDGFSRWVSRGIGDGFPRWAVAGDACLRTPDHHRDHSRWPVLMATDPATYRSFRAFFDDREGVRTRYLAMTRRVASAFASIPGVIGYDLLNEPWGDERRDLTPLYADAAAAVRSVDPRAILFLEGHVTTNVGLPTRLPRPSYGGVAYAPHYYKIGAVLGHGWRGGSLGINLAFHNMRSTAEGWQAPLFVGEFGLEGTAENAGPYLDAIYDRLDAAFASGAQWNYTPQGTPDRRDGWNGEDFHILGPDGRPRGNYVPRPFPRAVAGVPLAFAYRRDGGGWLELIYEARPDRGLTEIAVPPGSFPSGARLEVEGAGASATGDHGRGLLTVRAARPGQVRVRLVGPGH